MTEFLSLLSEDLNKTDKKEYKQLKEKDKEINDLKNKIFNISFIDIAIQNYNKGYYNTSLEYGFKSLKNEICTLKANYIILLSYHEMFDKPKTK